MSKRYPGGLITKTPVTPTTSSAPGVWTLEQALQYIKAGTWPLYVLSDPYFKYVTMLLHGDGTNGAQNNTFLDSSTNNFTITRNGNTTQGSFSPYGSNWSVNFPDSGSNNSAYISASISGALATTLQGSAQTREMWLFRTNSSSSNIAVFRLNGSDVGTIYFSGGNLAVYNGSNIISVSAATYVPIGVWTHIAVTLSGGVVTLWINGTSVGTASGQSFSSSSGTLTLGGAGDMQSVGYISNMRVSNTARYSATFTPSTTPFTSDANTTLLCFQSNRFIDTSGNNIALTITVGTPSVQRFSPFSPSAAYSTSTIGGSGYFDGTGDYLTAATNSNIQIGATQDFTFEAWVYLNSLSNAAIFGMNSKNYLIVQSSTNIIFNGDVDPQLTFSGSTLSVRTWYHIAVTRASGTVKCFVNGAQYGSSQSEASKTYFTQQSTLGIGALSDGSYIINGYIADVRVTKGAALYTTTFTPPTLPLTTTVSSGTAQFLTNFTNGGIFDNAMMNNLETVGNAQISTSVFKYGTGSLYWNGTSGSLVTPTSPVYAMGSGPWTIEAWVYVTSTSGYRYIIDFRNGGGATSQLGMYFNNGTTTLNVFCGATNDSPSGSVSLNTWAHVAMVKNGSTVTVYINGTSTNSFTDTQDFSAATYVSIGHRYTIDQYFIGNIDDLRITKGYARYTANFTPPAAAFPNQ